ncbi:hypothetical protein MRX96_018367 [Rhipicephalus microplus]
MDSGHGTTACCAFSKPNKKVVPGPVDDANCLGGLFEQHPDIVACTTISGSGQRAEVLNEFRNLLGECKALFTKLPSCTTLIEHCIDTGDSTPVRTKLRPVNPKKQHIMDACLDEMLEGGLIRRSTSSGQVHRFWWEKNPEATVWLLSTGV